MNIVDVVLVVAGLLLLIAGGEALVRGASTLAVKAGLPPLVIGLVVVSAATSAPEFAVTVGAVLEGKSGLAVGNVVGSNIINILVILGISAIISPLIIKRQLVRFDIPVMVGLSLLLVVVSLDGRISVFDGILLLAGLIFHIIMSILVGRRTAAKPEYEPSEMPLNSKPVSLWFAALLLSVGIGLLVFGAQLLVSGAVSIATDLGVSNLIIGLTVVAIGTSLPELVTALIALRRGERDMAVGNVVGSNLFNIGMVLGLPAIIFGEGIPVPAAAIALDLPLMLAAAVALLPIAFTGLIISRWEGALFVGLYAAYTLYLGLASTEHDSHQGFTTVTLWFVLPLVALAIIAAATQEIRLIHGSKNKTAAKTKGSPET